MSLRAIYPDGTRPVMLSRVAAQRSLKIRNRYTFRLPWRFVLLEPLDIVTLTEPEIGLNLTPVRILSITEEGEVLSVIAEDYPAGVAAAASYAPQVGDGYVPAETATTQEIPTSLTGLNAGIAAGIVGPAVENLRRRAGNLVPNGEFMIWTPPRVREDCPPDAWEIGTSASGISVAFGDFVATPEAWRALGASTPGWYFSTDSHSGDLSVVQEMPAAASWPGPWHVIRLADDALIPVAEGEVFEWRYASKRDATVGASEYTYAALQFLDASKAYISGVGHDAVPLLSGWWEFRYAAKAPASAKWVRLIFAQQQFASGDADIMLVDRVSLAVIPPSFRAAKSTAQTIPTGAGYTIIAVNSISVAGGVNDGSCLDLSTGRFTAPRDGLYDFSGSVGLVNLPGSAYMIAAIAVDGTNVAKSAQTTGVGTGTTIAPVQTSIYLTKGQIVDLRVTHSHTAGVAVSTTAGDTYFAGSGR